MSKKLIYDLIKISKNVETTKKFDDGTKWKAEVEGEYKDMSRESQKGFNDKQIEQLASLMDLKLKPVENRLDSLETDVKDIKNRLAILETDVKEIKSLPTIRNEMKLIYKK